MTPKAIDRWARVAYFIAGIALTITGVAFRSGQRSVEYIKLPVQVADINAKVDTLQLQIDSLKAQRRDDHIELVAVHSLLVCYIRARANSQTGEGCVQ